MIISNLSSNISFSGKLNVFSFNPQTTLLENTLVDTSSIIGVKSIINNGKKINVLSYISPQGRKTCSSLNIFPDFTEEKLRLYLGKEILNSNRTGNVVDFLL